MQALLNPHFTSRRFVGIVATRSYLPTIQSGDTTTWMSRSFHYARDYITLIKIAFANWYVPTGGGGVETGSGGNTTVSGGIEVTVDGTTRFYQMKWAGASSVTASNNTTFWTDWIPIYIPKGTKFYIRRRWTGAAGVTYNQDADGAHAYVTAGDAVQNTNTDLTMSGTVTDDGFAISMYPIAVVGYTRNASVLVLGDSRQAGINDNSDTGSSTAPGDQGEVCRAIGGSLAYINMGVASEQAADFTSTNASKRIALGRYATHIIGAHGINDIHVTGVTASTLETDVKRIRALFPNRPYIHCTLPPESTGAWTLANLSDQTADSSTARNTFNSDLLAGSITTVDSSIDICNFVESSTASGKWKADGTTNHYTTDGIHETTFANQQIVVSADRFAVPTGIMPRVFYL